MNLGPEKILLIIVLALLLFGPDRLPEMARTAAKGMKELRKLQDSVRGDIDQVMQEAGLRDEPPTDPTRTVANNLDHEASSGGFTAVGSFPAYPGAPTFTAESDSHGRADGSEEVFPIDIGSPSTNEDRAPEPRSGPLELETVDSSGDDFPSPGSFS